jgi:error-prone DNA polymerase
VRREVAERIERERKVRRFSDVDDLQRRCALRLDELERLAEAGALASLGLTRRAALWQAALAVRPAGELFEDRRGGAARDETAEPSQERYPLPEMSAWENTVADFATTGLTAGRHPLAYFRPALEARGILSAAELSGVPHGARVKTAGSVIVRQRPGTAKGILFMTLEDETGMSQAIVHRDLLRDHRKTIVGSNGLVVEGLLEQRDGSVSIRAERFWPLAELVTVPSHDFR